MHKVSRFFKPLPCPTPAPKKLYLLKCEATGLYKIGATSEDVKIVLVSCIIIATLINEQLKL